MSMMGPADGLPDAGPMSPGDLQEGPAEAPHPGEAGRGSPGTDGAPTGG